MAEQANDDSGFDIFSHIKTLGKKAIKPLTGAATVVAGYGAGQAARWGLEEGLEQGLNSTLQGVADYAPIGGAALGAVFAPVAAEKAESLILNKPRIIQTRIDGMDLWVIASLPHLHPQPRIFNSGDEIIVEGVKVVEVEASAYGKDPQTEKAEDFPEEALGAAARQDVRRAESQVVEEDTE